MTYRATRKTRLNKYALKKPSFCCAPLCVLRTIDANFTAYYHSGWWSAAFSPASAGIPLTAVPYPLVSLLRCSCLRVTYSGQKHTAPSFCRVSLSSSSLRTSYPCRLPGKVFRRRYHQPTHGIVFAFRRSSLDRLSMSTFVTLSWGRLFTGCVYTKKSSYF